MAGTTKSVNSNCPSTTSDPDRGIRDIWLDDAGHQYLVTEAGTIVHRTVGGAVTTLYDGDVTLTGIWGTAPDNFYAVGLTKGIVLHCDHDPGAGTFSFEEIDLSHLWDID